ncbi:PTS lactose/cellobiose transporter subunit IIA [Brevibacillus nitrificans]|uniref:PTS system lichenan oligosaccharide-specific IIA component, Lac family n=3 Tax=Brevibacillus TaxID=55080 RepID=A0A1I3V6G2_9BACL|nr:PTS lactose/cellobiose transporter subunit IIA [Brevibacillus centrosporus]RNB79820.1 PTS lactose/cellobiose transporter subunit IIA [Brevibacillus nitrificans]GED30132.1 lichenan-specific phosphotransferase enzyme IIA component [Brevibacillus centrosporus]SFJ90730.1 PTS system lichenan oligosaccharide-specific IIA component, Lac family [Brevibacillus centrosporus]
MDHTEMIFQLILHGGNARSLAMEAIALAKNKDMAGAKNALAEAGEELSKAHQNQTAFIQKEVSGEKTELSMLLIHAQDHVMNAMTIKDLASEFVEMYGHIHESKGAGV